MKELDIYERKNHLPWKLSGGEKQRLSIAREMLKKGKVLPPLTKKSRSKAEFAKYGRKPLYKTRALYKSIKGNSKGLHMLDYGKMHNDGFGKNTQREFIKIDKEEQDKLTEELLKAIDEALGTGSVINF